MKTSESIKTIAPLLLEAQKKMGDVKKGAANPYFNSSYADLNSIREAAIPVLNALGIAVLQPTVVVDGKNYVETMLLHISGEFVSSQTAIVNDKGTAQAEGSGLSYARRYGLQSLLNIGAVDDDAEGATGRGKNTFEKKLTTAASKVDPKSNTVDSSSLTTTTKKSTFRKASTKPVELATPKAVEDSMDDDFDTTAVANGHDEGTEEDGDWI